MRENAMPDDELEKLISDFAALGRKIYAMGKDAERARLMALLQSSDAESGTSLRPARVRAPWKPRARRSTLYGAVSTPVRRALSELSADSPSGVTVGDLAAHFELQGSGPTTKQIRAALKQLTKTAEAVNIARGKYLSRQASESLRAENSGADTPEHFSLAAE
jgi:hypothetical protein